MKVALPLALALVAVALAGCAGNPPKACPSTGCPASASVPTTAPSVTTLPPTPTNGPVNATLPYFVFESCRGLHTSVDVPSQLARSYIPEDFLLAGRTPFTTLFHYIGFECDRLVTTNATLNGIKALWTFASVEPKESTWDAPGRNQFVFDAFVSDAGVAAAMAAYGLPVKQATFTIERTDGPNGATMEDWSVDGPTLQLDFTIKHGNDKLPGPDETWRDWYGSGPYNRVTSKHKAEYYGPTAADGDVTQVAGSSPFHAAVGDTNTFTGAPLVSLSWVIDSAVEHFQK
jgi:hypothetical protein